MKVCFTLICLFFLTLQDGEAAETHARMGGENITVECKVNLIENPIIFCKENCEGENILISTTEDKAHNGRYSTFYESGYTSASLYVSISDLKRSDSGRYRCGLGKNRSRYHEFHLDVTEDETDQLLYVGLSLVLIILLATALLIYCRRKNLYQQKGLQLYLVLTLVAMIILLSTPLVIFCWNSRAMKSKGLQLYVFLSLVIKITLLSTPLVIFCWKRRAMKSKDSAVEAEYDDVSQINPERDESKEDRQNNSSAEEISSVYC
ncbi:uncharacterized protein LOC106960679 isoform X4 [Poecilia latipinna]|uniref:uncharacterized protein LOC106960679 isoform X4 n=1 Tax=Poecilia latipinna TaxID=48699 RepID=UPI00072DF4B4|nr:PREDICTED: uncharacterized protein LOC106960679 isoform X4 [Poecilia latipinna]